jgi:hypothetical protein
MKTFKGFLITEGRGKMTASGTAGEDHLKKYIQPHIGSQEFTHTLAADHEDLPAGSKIKIKGAFKNLDGKIHVNAEDHVGDKHIIPISKLYKPGEAKPNKGHDYENKFVERLKHHGVMPSHLSGAGSTAGTDFALENRKTGKFHPGTVNGNLLNGETKDGVSAAMGQLTIHHTAEKGWHIGDAARKKRPLYAKQIEKSGILDHMNQNFPNPNKVKTTESGRAKTIEIKHPDLNPAHAYLQDHHVHVLQVGGFGTYSVGKKDETGHGLPKISGKGVWRIREKQKGNKSARTVAFHPDGKNGLNKSHVDLDNDEHLFNFKKSLGFKE